MFTMEQIVEFEIITSFFVADTCRNAMFACANISRIIFWMLYSFTFYHFSIEIILNSLAIDYYFIPTLLGIF